MLTLKELGPRVQSQPGLRLNLNFSFAYLFKISSVIPCKFKLFLDIRWLFDTVMLSLLQTFLYSFNLKLILDLKSFVNKGWIISNGQCVFFS